MQNAYYLQGQVFSKFKISILIGKKRAAGEIFETQNDNFLRWKVLTQLNISIFSGKKKAQAKFWKHKMPVF